jgi:hypothetical protein
MTEEQAQAMLVQLREHYREPVMPVSTYCNSFIKWRLALEQAAKRKQAEAA